MNPTRKLLTCGAFTLVLGSLAADATMIFTFQRISDTEATLTASGSVDDAAPTGVNIGRFGALELRGVMTNAGAGPTGGSVTQNPGSDVTLGVIGIQGWAVVDGDMIVSPNFNFENGDVLTGTSTGTASGNIVWLPVGATGDVYALYEPQTSAGEGFRGPRMLGTWEIIAVPDSGSSILLLGSSLGVVLAGWGWPSSRRRRVAGACPRRS